LDLIHIFLYSLFFETFPSDLFTALPVPDFEFLAALEDSTVSGQCRQYPHYFLDIVRSVIF